MDGPTDEVDAAEDDEAIVRRLLTEPFEIEGRMPWSSNGTFLVSFGSEDRRAIYKPTSMERPLWDFPAGLHRREVAAYELSRALGWSVIPPTVIRTVDAELGEGSLQHFVDADFEQHHFTLVEDERHHDQLRRICLFDVLANNTDRKSGHCLVDRSGSIWGIDNGLCFAEEFKLRTVIWEFGGEDIAPELLDDIARVSEDVPATLAELLDDDEIDAFTQRCFMLITNRRYPIDPTGHRYPWPLV
ncbi:MAG: SCO1664 family protein [Actinomycetota bacterium]